MTKESYATQVVSQVITHTITRVPGWFDRKTDLLSIGVRPEYWPYVQTLLDAYRRTRKPILGFTLSFHYDPITQMWIGEGTHWSYQNGMAYSVRSPDKCTRLWADPRDAWEDAERMGLGPSVAYLHLNRRP